MSPVGIHVNATSNQLNRCLQLRGAAVKILGGGADVPMTSKNFQNVNGGSLVRHRRQAATPAAMAARTLQPDIGV